MMVNLSEIGFIHFHQTRNSLYGEADRVAKG